MFRLILLAVSPLLLACRDTPTVVVTTVSRGSVEATVTGVNSGTVQAEQIAELAFGAVGRVKLVSASVGDLVGKGAILAEIENEDLKSRLDVATEELMRAKTLERSRAASRSNVIQAQGEYDAARVAYEKSIIRAPFEGIVVERNVEAGQLSQITAVIPLAPFRLVDTQQRYVEVQIDEVDLPKVTVGMPARVKILAVRREPFKAMVRKVVPFVSSVREQDRTSQLELDVEGEGVLLPAGASADVEIVTSVQNSTLLTTPKAVLGRGGDRYVFTVESSRLHKVPVKVGISGYTATELLSGVSEGTVIALPSDTFEFREGLKVQIKTS